MMYKLSYLDDNGNTVATEPTWFASEGEALIIFPPHTRDFSRE